MWDVGYFVLRRHESLHDGKRQEGIPVLVCAGNPFREIAGVKGIGMRIHSLLLNAHFMWGIGVTISTMRIISVI